MTTTWLTSTYQVAAMLLLVAATVTALWSRNVRQRADAFRVLKAIVITTSVAGSALVVTATSSGLPWT